MRGNIGSLLGGLVGFAVAYFGVGALLSVPGGTTTPLIAESSAPTHESDGEVASLVELSESTDPISVPAGAAAAAEEPAETVAAAQPAPNAMQRRGFLLHGVVAVRGGSALAGAYVGVQLPSGGRAGSTTDKLGRYALGPLDLQTWSVNAGMTDHHTVVATIAPPSDDSLVRHDFELVPQQVVRVRIVTSEGEPAIAALFAAKLYAFQLKLVPVATSEEPGETFTEVHGSLSNPLGIGWFRNSEAFGPPAKTPDEYGTVTLREDGPAWLSLVAAHQVIAKQPLAPGTDVVTFVVDVSEIAALYATVRGRALDAASGSALAAQAWLRDDPFVHGESGAASDAATGEFVVERALPGKRWLIVKCPEYADAKRQVTVQRGGTFDAGEILLHRPVALSGKIHDTEGKPYEATVEWGVLDTASGAVEWVQHAQAQSKADGTFTVPGLEPAVYVIRSTGPATRGPKGSAARILSRPLRADARTGSVEGIDLQLVSTTVVTIETPLRVQPAGGNWTQAIVVGPDGLPVARGWPGRYADETPLLVPPGEWALVLTRDEVELERRPLVVGDAPLRIALDL